MDAIQNLLVLLEGETDRLIAKAHEFTPVLLVASTRGKKKVEVGERAASITHAGIRRTFETISSHYYHHALRAKITSYIQRCTICHLNNHARGNKDPMGMQSPMTPGQNLAFKFAGPWHTESTFKYVFCAIDLFSQYLFIFPTRSTRDKDVLDCLLRIRREWEFH